MPTDHRVAIVTGASRGIGRAIALRLAADQRHLVLVSRSAGPLGDLKHQIEQSGGSASVETVDVADTVAVAAMVERVADTLGRVDILVNNAGVTKDGLLMRMSMEDWNQVIQTNLTSAFAAIRAASRPMMKARFGRIVNIGSTSGVVGNTGQANYAAAKAGLIGLTKSVARELGGKGITCNCICPGFIETDMTASLPQPIKDGALQMMAIKRLGAPDDIAAAVAYATSDGAGFLTGQTVCVDGGMTMC